MKRIRILTAVLALVAATTFANRTDAGLYTTAETTPFRIEADRAIDLPYVPQFKSYLDDRLNAANPALPDMVDGKPTFRGAAKQRIEQRGKNTARLPVADQAALAVDQIRVGQAADAVNLLEHRTRDRVPDYVALVTLAHAHAARGEWSDAIRVHSLAMLDAEPPAQLPGATPEQTRWLVKVEKEYYARWLRLRHQESLLREPAEEQNVYPLFPVKADSPSVKFVNEEGKYEPGKLAAAERAKLPPDAIAIVQQLLLWAPDDTRMLWLLAEIYNANGLMREADQIYDQCTWGRGYTNRRILMAHRTATREVVSKLPPEDAEVIPNTDPVKKPSETKESIEDADRKKWDEIRPQIYLGVAVIALLAVILIPLQIRTLIRRRRTVRR